MPAVVASNLFIGLALVALLYFGRELFVPVVVALLLSFVLAPVVRLFRRLPEQINFLVGDQCSEALFRGGGYPTTGKP
ncbi:hypothetical protein A6X20_17465 [Bradyrhizobium elkanii]|nr:hypothetical protein A6X20_17465 [Bradyrhizobium elkanii]ODM85342.1 hypothetical protein A6452_12035 [Bradyrhizobium elkanii]